MPVKERKEYGMAYTYLSELLRDMPTDEELEKLYLEAGIRKVNPARRCLQQKDLLILLLRLDGWSYARIGREFGVSANAVRAKMLPTKMRLKSDLNIKIDIEGLFL